MSHAQMTRPALLLAALVSTSCTTTQERAAAPSPTQLSAPAADAAPVDLGQRAVDPSDAGPDPFLGGADALAVDDEDEGQSLRAKLALQRLPAGALLVRVVDVDTTSYPSCVVTGKVLAVSREGLLQRRLKRGQAYRFAAWINRPAAQLDLDDGRSRRLLGLCYCPEGTRLGLTVSGKIDRDARAIQVRDLLAVE